MVGWLGLLVFCVVFSLVFVVVVVGMLVCWFFFLI